MKKLAILAVLLICAIIVVFGAIIVTEEHHEKKYHKKSDSFSKHNYVDSSIVVIGSNSANDNANQRSILKEVNNGYVDLTTGEFYASQNLREFRDEEYSNSNIREVHSKVVINGEQRIVYN